MTTARLMAVSQMVLGRARLQPCRIRPNQELALAAEGATSDHVTILRRVLVQRSAEINRHIMEKNRGRSEPFAQYPAVMRQSGPAIGEAIP